MKRIVAGGVILTVALMNAAGGQLLAQATPTDTLAAVCTRAADSLQSGVRGQPYYNALSDLATCPSQGSATLAEAWRKAPTDTTALRLLGETTPRLRDEGVFRVVLSTFRDQDQPRAVRLAALEALVGYYQPGMGVRYVEPDHPVRSGSAYVMLGQGESPSVATGRTSMATTARQEILQALTSVGSDDPDDRISLIAAYVKARLSSLP